PAKAMGIPVAELASLIRQGQSVPYEAGAFLFHESTPREWIGIVVDGEVEVVRGLHGRQTQLATLRQGTLSSESICIDDNAHCGSVRARGSAVVHQIPRTALEALKAGKPDTYYRIVARVAQRLSDRLRAASELLAESGEAPSIASFRVEHDSLGER